jgi:hypothetical protein
MRRVFLVAMFCTAAMSLTSCGRGPNSAIPASTRAWTQDRLVVNLEGAEVAYDATATVTSARGILFIRSSSRAAALDLAKVQRVTRIKGGIPADISLGTIAEETSFFNKPIRPQVCPTYPLSAQRQATDLCDLPADDMFSKIEYATGPGDLIVGRANGGNANCDNYFQVGTWWRSSPFDILSGAGDSSGFCIAFAAGPFPLRPILSGLATDYRYDSIRGLAALDMALPGNKNSNRSFLLVYRGRGILVDGSVGQVGMGQTSATFNYWLGPYGPTAVGSILQINVYAGNLAPLGTYLGYGRGTNPRLVAINE